MRSISVSLLNYFNEFLLPEVITVIKVKCSFPIRHSSAVQRTAL